MVNLTRAARLRVAFACAILGTILSTSFVAAEPALSPSDSPDAQNAAPPAAPVVTARAPYWGAGNITFTGVAVDCSTGQPATRVAVYDGTDPSAPYVADVAMDTLTDLGRVCPGRSGTARIGYTLIYDTRVLTEGVHTLLF